MWALGWVNLLPAARGSQKAGLTQPRAHLLTDPCTYHTNCEISFESFIPIQSEPSLSYLLNHGLLGHIMVDVLRCSSVAVILIDVPPRVPPRGDIPLVKAELIK